MRDIFLQSYHVTWEDGASGIADAHSVFAIEEPQHESAAVDVFLEFEDAELRAAKTAHNGFLHHFAEIFCRESSET